MPVGDEAADEEGRRALPRICFIHIPKTAGTAIRERMSELYCDLAFPALTTEGYAATSDEDLARYRFFAGHPYRRDWSRLPADTKVFTVLRDPVARAISLYKYWHVVDATSVESRGPRFALMVDALRVAKTRPIEEFLQSDNPFIVLNLRSAYASQLVPSVMVHECHISGAPSVAAFEAAVAQLFALDAVLTTERLGETFPRAMERLALSGIDVRLNRRNVSAIQLECDRPRLEEIMRLVSPVDYQLYAVARELEARMA
jgi:Sulfotransferase family